MLILHQKVRNCSGGASNVSFCKKATVEEEKQDFLNPGSWSSVDAVAMGTGVGTCMEVTGCWKLWQPARAVTVLNSTLKTPSSPVQQADVCVWKNRLRHYCRLFLGCCLQCERYILSVSAWRFLHPCGCFSAPGHICVYLHLHGSNYNNCAPLLTKTSSKHQLLFRWNSKQTKT